MRGTRNGFTLLELLVVIAIIAVLVALLFPTARGVYVAALEFQCENRIGELAKITMAYCAANDENFPPPCSAGAMPGSYKRGWLYGSSGTSTTANVDEGLFAKKKMLGSKTNLVCPVHVANFQMEPGPVDACKDAWVAYKTTQKAQAGRKYGTYPIVMSSYAMNDAVWTTPPGSLPRKRRDFSPTHLLFVEEHPTKSRYQDGSMLPSVDRDCIADHHHGGGYVACMGGQVFWMSTAEYNLTITNTEQKTRRWDPM